MGDAEVGSDAAKVSHLGYREGGKGDKGEGKIMPQAWKRGSTGEVKLLVMRATVPCNT